MKKSIMKKYAEAVVKVGANVQENQYVMVYASTNQAEFVKMLVDECYKAKARYVRVEWSNDEIAKSMIKNVKYETYIENSELTEYRLQNMCKLVPVCIYVEDSDPDCFKGLDMKARFKARQDRYPIEKKYYDELENKYQWVICAMPSKEWAKKVFPDMKVNEAYKKLEEAILKTTRIDKNALQNWEDHIKELEEKADKLNELDLDYLEYKSTNGTNLKLHLMPNHRWLSARGETLKTNISYAANMPTEEVFTMPKPDAVEGIVYSTKPLSLRGKLVENFSITFEKGRVTKVEAEKGKEVLEELLSDDEGSKHLGEVALVPYDSPINQSKILFYNTLFDENASCHLALGASFKDTIKGYEELTDEDWEKMGFNDSMNHVDFMVGSEDLDIVGTKHDGTKVQIFKKGNWAL